jgi:transporter family-2 protein
MSWLSFVIAFVAGAFITIQAGTNSQLKKSLGVPMPAMIVNYLLGVTSIVLYMLVKREPLPAMAKAGEAPWWSWTGGLFGAAYGVTAVLLASQMGASTLTALVVTGQLVCSVIVDHFGWVGFEVHPASTWRIIGCMLMVAGLVLIARF